MLALLLIVLGFPHFLVLTSFFQVVNNSEDNESVEVDKIGKKIRSEIKELPAIKNEYPVLNKETLNNSVIPTLNQLLISISPKFESNTLASALISNIVTIISSSNVSMLTCSRKEDDRMLTRACFTTFTCHQMILLRI